MLHHIGITPSDLARSLGFYDRALAPLGIRRLMAIGGSEDLPDHVGYGEDRRPYFWLGRGEPLQGYVHVAFAAANRQDVDAFYRAALAAGGRDNGPPGLREHYHPDYYGAFVLDPDGYNIEAVCLNF
jgi:catechol 2,3-dioxygenase-like lactoylglutathione lyase family enzyme